MDLDLSSTVLDQRTVVHVAGEIDVYTAPSLRRYLDDQIQRGARELVVDLSAVTFLDSTGLGVLVGRLRVIRGQSGSLLIVGARDRVLKVFTITGLDTVFPMADTLADLEAPADPTR